MSALQQSVRRIVRTASTSTVPVGREQAPSRVRLPELPSARTEQIRSRNLQLIHEALARAQMHERIAVAEQERAALRVIRARRLRKKTENVGFRARRALATALRA